MIRINIPALDEGRGKTVKAKLKGLKELMSTFDAAEGELGKVQSIYDSLDEDAEKLRVLSADGTNRNALVELSTIDRQRRLLEENISGKQHALKLLSHDLAEVVTEAAQLARRICFPEINRELTEALAPFFYTREKAEEKVGDTDAWSVLCRKLETSTFMAREPQLVRKEASRFSEVLSKLNAGKLSIEFSGGSEQPEI